MWIEIYYSGDYSHDTIQSLPVRECGLKYPTIQNDAIGIGVTPRAGVWIEMIGFTFPAQFLSVTPRAGVWIEICRCINTGAVIMSLPVRECGLK